MEYNRIVAAVVVEYDRIVEEEEEGKQYNRGGGSLHKCETSCAYCQFSLSLE